MANTFVIGASVVLFLLWFRYMCSLLLAAQTSLDNSESVARANTLAFGDVLRDLDSGEVRSKDDLRKYAAVLQRDYDIVTYLLRHMGGHPLVGSPTETWMLRVDYKLQKLQFHLMLPVSSAAAAHEVRQMAIIICHFADLIGERRVPARV